MTARRSRAPLLCIVFHDRHSSWLPHVTTESRKHNRSSCNVAAMLQLSLRRFVYLRIPLGYMMATSRNCRCRHFAVEPPSDSFRIVGKRK